MTVRVEHAEFEGGGGVGSKVADEIRTRCEIRSDVDVLKPGTLPKTEFKAARVKDRRNK